MKKGTLTLATADTVNVVETTLSIAAGTTLELGGKDTTEVSVGTLTTTSMKGELILQGTGSNTVDGDVALKNATLMFAKSSEDGAENSITGVLGMNTGGVVSWKGKLSVGGLAGSTAGKLTNGNLIITGDGGNFQGDLGNVNLTMNSESGGTQKLSGANFASNTFEVNAGVLEFTKTTTLGGDVSVTGGTLKFDARRCWLMLL